MKKFVFALTVFCFSMPLFAGETDKLASVPQLWGQGLLFGVLLFLTARYRWWLAIPLMPLAVMYFTSAFDLWNDPIMRQAIKVELGYSYVLSLFIAESLLIVGLVVGVIFNWRSLWKAYLYRKEYGVRPDRDDDDDL